MQGTGLIRVPSKYSVDETVKRVQSVLAQKGLQVFSLVDHSGEAEKAGMKMPPTKLLVFGSPKAGTPVMLAAPSIAIDLPLKILIAEVEAGKTTITYTDPEFLQERHGVPGDLVKNISGAGAVVAKAME